MNAFETTVAMGPGEAEAAVRQALGEQGFGVLTEIDVSATLKAKLGVERKPLKILGACNPGFAHRALEIDPNVSLQLPCNVVIEGLDDRTRVAAADPRDLLADPRFEALAAEAAEALRAAIASVAGSGES
ncbi:MAG TPA: DUF302 domain-containing protein [Acidimicrobiales bacterium]|nr:DUF302 domain-containing protein [Acidimicrobiales bacterium]